MTRSRCVTVILLFLIFTLSSPEVRSDSVSPVGKIVPTVTVTPTATVPATVTIKAPEQSLWQSLMVDVIQTSLAIATPVLSVLAFWLLRRLGLKVNLSRLDEIAGQAALYAEQMAAQHLKEGLPKSSGAQKETWAWDLVKEVDAKLGGSELARSKLRALILSKIPEAEQTVASAETAKALNVPVGTP